MSKSEVDPFIEAMVSHENKQKREKWTPPWEWMIKCDLCGEKKKEGRMNYWRSKAICPECIRDKPMCFRCKQQMVGKGETDGE